MKSEVLVIEAAPVGKALRIGSFGLLMPSCMHGIINYRCMHTFANRTVYVDDAECVACSCIHRHAECEKLGVLSTSTISQQHKCNANHHYPLLQPLTVSFSQGHELSSNAAVDAIEEFTNALAGVLKAVDGLVIIMRCCIDQKVEYCGPQECLIEDMKDTV